MREHIRYIDHQDEKILFVDFSHCPASEVEKIARAVPDVASRAAPNSVLVLSDFMGATLDNDAMRALKETAVFDKPFVRKSALIGTQTFPVKFFEELTTYSRRSLRIFESREEALAWLLKDS